MILAIIFGALLILGTIFCIIGLLMLMIDKTIISYIFIILGICCYLIMIVLGLVMFVMYCITLI